MPRVTGRTEASKAHRASRESDECFRLSIKTRAHAKQTAGVTVRINIQSKGVADQSLLKPLVAYQTQALPAQSSEQTSSAMDSADGVIFLETMLCVAFMITQTMSPEIAHAQINRTAQAW